MQMREIATLTALAAALSLVERFLPGPVFWFKPGLANIVTLALAARGKYRSAVLVTFLRGFVVALAWGGLFSPGHIFSLTGGAIAVGVTVFLCRFLSGLLSLIGVSVAAALAHSLGQLAVGRLLFVSEKAVVTLLPFALLAAVITGILVGYLTRKVLARGWLE